MNPNFLDRLLDDIPKQTNLHLVAMLVQAFLDGKIEKRPGVRFKNRIDSENRSWLVNLVSRCGGFIKASFGGAYADEFEHLSKRKLKLIDFEVHMKRMARANAYAISNVKFGYEDDDDNDENDNNDDDNDDFLDFLDEE